MKRILFAIALIGAALTANAQHSLQIDDGTNITIIEGGPTGGTYAFPGGGGTILTVTGAALSINGNSLSWPNSASGYLYNNGSGGLSWGNPSGSGATINFARKTANESISSAADASETTMQDDDDLSFTFGANEIWEIDGVLLDTAQGTGVDMNFAFACAEDAGTTLTLHYNTFYASTAGGFQLNGDGTGVLMALDEIGKADMQQDRQHSTYIKGLVFMGGTGGTVKLRWAFRTNVAAGKTLTVRAGSYLKATKVQ